MHYHYHTLKQLAAHFNQHHRGEMLESCFSQSKNELILAFEHLTLRIGCHTPLTYVIPVATFARARKNVAELFPQLVGLSWTNSRVVPHERILILEFEQEYALILKLHGSQANILLSQGSMIRALFNQDREKDWEFVETAGPYHPEIIQQAPASDSLRAIVDHLKLISPIYDRRFAKRIQFLLQQGLRYAAVWEQVHRASQSPPFYIARVKDKLGFYLFPPPESASFVEFEKIDEALSIFLKMHFQWDHYRKNYRSIAKEIQAPYEKYQKIYASYQRSIAQIEGERNPEELGHILMAHLHEISPGESAVEVEDFYQGGRITLKVKPTLSPQENATYYYDKHKQRKKRLQYLYGELDDLQQKLQAAAEKYQQFSALPPPEALILTPKGFESTALQALKAFRSEQTQLTPSTPPLPFRKFERDGYEIFVGKNARNNDELSFKFAHKEDVWLHAKDVTGSHVIIRQKAGQNLPKPVLEYAASLAAFYSKRKNDTVVPVQYTPRKYIRKRKGDPPGRVVVSREQVILVEPQQK